MLLNLKTLRTQKMLHSVVYIVVAKRRLIELLEDSNPELLECLKGPSAWIAKESAASMDDLPDERLIKFKILYFLWLLRSYCDLLTHLPPGSGISLNIFDELWDVHRIEVEGDLIDL